MCRQREVPPLWPHPRLPKCSNVVRGQNCGIEHRSGREEGNIGEGDGIWGVPGHIDRKLTLGLHRASQISIKIRTHDNHMIISLIHMIILGSKSHCASFSSVGATVLGFSLL